jgi:hypothetical protein
MSPFSQGRTCCTDVDGGCTTATWDEFREAYGLAKWSNIRVRTRGREIQLPSPFEEPSLPLCQVAFRLQSLISFTLQRNFGQCAPCDWCGPWDWRGPCDWCRSCYYFHGIGLWLFGNHWILFHVFTLKPVRRDLGLFERKTVRFCVCSKPAQATFVHCSRKFNSAQSVLIPLAFNNCLNEYQLEGAINFRNMTTSDFILWTWQPRGQEN